MTRILVVHGAGMDRRGLEQVEIFGTTTLPEYDAAIRGFAAALGVEVEIVQSNAEDEVVARLRAADAPGSGVDGVAINPAGFTRGHPALAEAVRAMRLPVVEVHVSNPARRGLVSDVLAASRGGVSGFGLAGYGLALRGLKDLAGGG